MRDHDTNEKQVILDEVEFELFDRQAAVCKALDEVVLDVFQPRSPNIFSLKHVVKEMASVHIVSPLTMQPLVRHSRGERQRVDGVEVVYGTTAMTQVGTCFDPRFYIAVRGSDSPSHAHVAG